MSNKSQVETNKGTIRDNALKALVKSNLFRHKVYKNKKGKGSYSRKGRAKSGFRILRETRFFMPLKTLSGFYKAGRQISDGRIGFCKTAACDWRYRHYFNCYLGL